MLLKLISILLFPFLSFHNCLLRTCTFSLAELFLWLFFSFWSFFPHNLSFLFPETAYVPASSFWLISDEQQNLWKRVSQKYLTIFFPEKAVSPYWKHFANTLQKILTSIVTKKSKENDSTKTCCERSTYNKISFWPFLIPLSFSFIFPTSPITFYTTQTIFWLQNSILPLPVHHYVWLSFSLNVQFLIFFSLSSSSTFGQSLHAIPGIDSKGNRFGSIKNRREIQHRHLGVLQAWYCR